MVIEDLILGAQLSARASIPEPEIIRAMASVWARDLEDIPDVELYPTYKIALVSRQQHNFPVTAAEILVAYQQTKRGMKWNGSKWKYEEFSRSAR